MFWDIFRITRISLKKTDIIPDYAREYKNEYLFIRGIDKTCEKFVKRLDLEGEVFKSPQANKIMLYFNKFLKAQQLEYLNDISESYLKENDVGFIESLELQLVDYSDLYLNPDSYEFDQERYDNMENNYPGFNKFFECFRRFYNKLKVEYLIEEDYYKSIIYDTDDDSDSDSDSDDGVVSDDINDIFNNCFGNSESDSDSD